MPINRKSERQFTKAVPTYSGGEGFYVFVPANGGGASDPRSSPLLLGPDAIRRAQAAIAPFIEHGHPRKKLSAPQETFEFVANEWFGINKDRWVETYRCRLRSRLDEDLLTELGGFLIDEIEPLTVLSTMRAIEQRGAVESAKRILNMASSIFRYGVAPVAVCEIRHPISRVRCGRRCLRRDARRFPRRRFHPSCKPWLIMMETS